MKKLLIPFLLIFSLAACKTEVKSAQAQEDHAKPAKVKDQKKKVEGEHNPPIEKSEVKEGHWYCDMGTVHYSHEKEGDGKCPLCGMKLHHKTSK